MDAEVPGTITGFGPAITRLRPELADMCVTGYWNEGSWWVFFDSGETFYDAIAAGDLEEFAFEDRAGYYERWVPRAAVPHAVVRLFDAPDGVPHTNGSPDDVLAIVADALGRAAEPVSRTDIRDGDDLVVRLETADMLELRVGAESVHMRLNRARPLEYLYQDDRGLVDLARCVQAICSGDQVPRVGPVREFLSALVTLALLFVLPVIPTFLVTVFFEPLLSAAMIALAAGAVFVAGLMVVGLVSGRRSGRFG
ncbi:hypothetical protein [Actinokineospora enzanensis]|uniref:hypothetical protein n=1 Tax=Actinokineospora enzanensis TaxID=155975 RepID=UPI00037CC777|nr:hypothetical protein [Actinokineospora enzanensis]